eukprot:TRINITY_DN68107_c11_g1_i1.p1 TRINITY_DN68107_c11_g1~~TRINITY_DN68107_c11_g1_i1.p1  ORF type:complete len:110 (-),score=16.34 TRINITY_DN68107_c11_g1_i1:64-393(-)
MMSATARPIAEQQQGSSDRDDSSDGPPPVTTVVSQQQHVANHPDIVGCAKQIKDMEVKRWSMNRSIDGEAFRLAKALLRCSCQHGFEPPPWLFSCQEYTATKYCCSKVP